MRGVRESIRYTEQAAALGIEVKRVDEITTGVVWGAANAAEEFAAVPGTDLRFAPTEDFPDAPSLRIFFRIIDDDQVELVWIEVVDDDPDDPILD